MSACYAIIAFSTSVLHEVPDTGISYDIRPGTAADQVFAALNAIGTIMFAFGGHAILLEVQVRSACPCCNCYRPCAESVAWCVTQLRLPINSTAC